MNKIQNKDTEYRSQNTEYKKPRPSYSEFCLLTSVFSSVLYSCEKRCISSNIAIYAKNNQYITELCLARIAIALKLYKQRHGTYPMQLDALVPADLEEIPRDPFTPDGKFIYRTIENGFILYSLAGNQIDDGGTVDESIPLRGDIVWRMYH